MSNSFSARIKMLRHRRSKIASGKPLKISVLVLGHFGSGWFVSESRT